MNEEDINTGYGFIGNISMSIILDMFEDEDAEKEYREYLEKEDKEAYDGFVQYEKQMNELIKE